VFEDGRRRLWVAADDEVCHADAPVVASGRPASWSCSKVIGAGTITSLAEASPGILWAGTTIGGVYRLASEDHWEPIAGSRKLPTLLVRKLRVQGALPYPRFEQFVLMSSRVKDGHGLVGFLILIIES
jgi:hypothetical protein